MASSFADQDALLPSSLQVASQAWILFDWNMRREQWDKTSSQTKEHREQSVAARKQLADTTKQFKRSVKSTEQTSSELAKDTTSQELVDNTIKSMEVLAKECRKTVKSYQGEIDNLTKRCKASEAAFSGMHLALRDVPDPTNMLASAAEGVHAQQSEITHLHRAVDDVNREMQSLEGNMAQQAELFQKEIAQLKKKASESDAGADNDTSMKKADREELVQLRREVAEYEVEFRGLKNQDITIRKLESKIADLQTAGEEQLKQELKKAQEELAETEGRRASDALEREAAMERKAQSLELQLKAERAGREATQSHLLDVDEGAGEREAAWEAQRQIMIDDGAHLRETLHEATRERDELRLRTAALGDATHEVSTTAGAPNSGAIGMADMILERKAYEAEVSELSHISNLLREELRLKEDMVADERRTMQVSIDSLEHDKARLSSSVTSLGTQLASAPSSVQVDSMKRELRILKRLEYNVDDVDAEKDHGVSGAQESDLESVLVAKMRRLESDIVKERTRKTEYFEQLQDLESRLTTVEEQKAEADDLVARLEMDLQSAIATLISSTDPGKSSLLEITATPRTEDSAALQRILDPDAPPLSGGITSMPMAVAVNAPLRRAVSEQANDDHSVATIVMAQRDRLRARCDALEAERDSFKTELQMQVGNSESLKSDNTKLYEKVRYLQNYNSKSGSLNNRQKSSTTFDRDLDLEALEQRYEASVDPFRQFNRNERQRKMKEMSPVERTVFIVARTFLGSKEMRMGLFFYVIGLHSLVFITIYHWSHSGCESYIDKDHLAHLPPVLNERIRLAAMRDA